MPFHLRIWFAAQLVSSESVTLAGASPPPASPVPASHVGDVAGRRRRRTRTGTVPSGLTPVTKLPVVQLPVTLASADSSAVLPPTVSASRRGGRGTRTARCRARCAAPSRCRRARPRDTAARPSNTGASSALVLAELDEHQPSSSTSNCRPSIHTVVGRRSPRRTARTSCGGCRYGAPACRSTSRAVKSPSSGRERSRTRSQPREHGKPDGGLIASPRRVRLRRHVRRASSACRTACPTGHPCARHPRAPVAPSHSRPHARVASPGAARYSSPSRPESLHAITSSPITDETFLAPYLYILRRDCAGNSASRRVVGKISNGTARRRRLAPGLVRARCPRRVPAAAARFREPTDARSGRVAITSTSRTRARGRTAR